MVNDGQPLVYQEPEPIFRKNKYIKYIFIDLMVVLLILGISYVVYYQTVLSSQNILLYDMEYFHNVIDSLLVPFQLDTLDCYSLEGTINFDEYYWHTIKDYDDEYDKYISNYRKGYFFTFKDQSGNSEMPDEDECEKYDKNGINYYDEQQVDEILKSRFEEFGITDDIVNADVIKWSSL